MYKLIPPYKNDNERFDAINMAKVRKSTNLIQGAVELGLSADFVESQLSQIFRTRTELHREYHELHN